MSDILISGGSGSFGTALARRLVTDHALDRIVIYSRGEHRQQEMALELHNLDKHDSLRFFIGDVRDRDRLEMAMRGVDTVIHAAALKGVPTCERNPSEAKKTNIDGADNVVHAALRAGVKNVLALSTDKACNPINVYGTTKLWAERHFIASNAYSGDQETRFSVVRYGNVIGSQGSVLPLFERFAEQGLPLPITHPDMTRFWITLEQGVEFVLNCLERMQGEEIFVPKLPSMRIADLANGMAPDRIQDVVGIRPGEKIHETLITEEEARTTDDKGDHYVIWPASYDKGRLPEGFRYSSDTNDEWLTWEKMQEMRAA